MAGKVVLITGAGSGIGRAVALGFLGQGDAVVLAGRRRAALEETAALAGAGAEFLVVPADVADAGEVAHLFERAAGEFGRLDVLFNNAGRGAAPTPFEDIPLDTWNQVVAVNLTGPFLCAQHAVRLMKAQNPRGGRIINNGSISAHSPRPLSAPYTATKHAITGLTRQIALDGRAHDVACGQIDIGNAATALTAAMSRGVPQADGRIAPEPVMDLSAVTQAVLMMAGLPLSANVQFIAVMATAMPFIGRG
ncbi:MAG TPA: SDR family oxidoreductase [Caulobacteraceae bacterium]|jgi:NAD(P)-dependent dehydrogenase (short-subunit alcohol dehydrogenase family)|nr:SDR family oxidoreductase [Caulobacteraceae bacterium]